MEIAGRLSEEWMTKLTTGGIKNGKKETARDDRSGAEINAEEQH